MTAFAPFDQFTATPEELARFAQLLEEDPEANLVERFGFFLAQDPGTAQQLLGFVPMILDAGWVAIVSPQEDGTTLGFSVGLHYRFGHPEVMLIGAIPPQEAQAVINAVGARICMWPEGQVVDAVGPDPQAGISARYTFERLDPASEVLEEYPYGYGWFFYRHFTSGDPREVPLLLAKVDGSLTAHPAGPGRQEGDRREVQVAGLSEPYWLWVEPAGEHWRVVSFPALTQNIAPGDLVRLEGDTLVGVVERGPFGAVGVLFEGTPLGEKTRVLTELREAGCELEHIVSESYGVAVPRERWDAVLELLDEADESVDWEALSGPDALTPCAGPFEPDDDDDDWDEEDED